MTIYMPDANSMAEMNQAAQAAPVFGGDGGKAKFVDFPGPNGTKWKDGATPGYYYDNTVFMAPLSALGKKLFAMRKSHFWKSSSNPGGMGGNCGGPNCPLCKGAEASRNSGDPRLVKLAEWGKIRTSYYFGVFELENPNAHVYEDGIMRDNILDIGPGLFKDITQLMDMRGGMSIFCNPQGARPLKIRRTKTGPATTNVDWSVVDLEPVVLPDMFHPAFENLWDLESLVQPSNEEYLIKAALEIGYPVHTGIHQVPDTYQQPMVQQPMAQQPTAQQTMGFSAPAQTAAQPAAAPMSYQAPPAAAVAPQPTTTVIPAPAVAQPVVAAPAVQQPAMAPPVTQPGYASPAPPAGGVASIPAMAPAPAVGQPATQGSVLPTVGQPAGEPSANDAALLAFQQELAGNK